MNEIKRYNKAKEDLSHMRLRRIKLNAHEFHYSYSGNKFNNMFNQSGNYRVSVVVTVYDKNQPQPLKNYKKIMKLSGRFYHYQTYYSMKYLTDEFPIVVTYLENSHILLDAANYVISDFDD